MNLGSFDVLVVLHVLACTTQQLYALERFVGSQQVLGHNLRFVLQ
jgi:hypothetical protein